MCNLRAFRGKFGNTCEAAASFIRWEGMGTPSVPLKILKQNNQLLWSVKLLTLLILVFLVQCFNEAGEQSCGGDVLESEKNPLSGQVKVQWLTLCYSSPRPECWDCDGQQHGIHISQVSPENANYGRNQLQTLQIPALKKWKNSDKRATTVTMFDKMLHWRMKLEGTNAKCWLRRNTSQQQQQIQLYCKPPERWPNWGMLVRRLQWNYVWRIFLTKWLKLVLHA